MDSGNLKPEMKPIERDNRGVGRLRGHRASHSYNVAPRHNRSVSRGHRPASTSSSSSSDGSYDAHSIHARQKDLNPVVEALAIDDDDLKRIVRSATNDNSDDEDFDDRRSASRNGGGHRNPFVEHSSSSTPSLPASTRLYDIFTSGTPESESMYAKKEAPKPVPSHLRAASRGRNAVQSPLAREMSADSDDGSDGETEQKSVGSSARPAPSSSQPVSSDASTNVENPSQRVSTLGSDEIGPSSGATTVVPMYSESVANPYLYSSYHNMLPPDYYDYDSDSEDEDPFEVVAEAAEEEKRENEDSLDWNNKSIKQILLKWFWKVVKYGLMISFFMAPGAICEFYSSQAPEFCFISGTPLMRFSLMISISVFGIFLSDLIVMLMMVGIQKTPWLGTQFLYYITNISKPLKWTIVTFIIFITWPNMFTGTPLVNSQTGHGKTVGVLVQQLISCLFATAFAFLGKSILMRFLAIGFHRGAYLKRIKSAFIAEYVLLNLIEAKEPKKRKVDAIVDTFSSFTRAMQKFGLRRPSRAADLEEAVNELPEEQVLEPLPLKEEDMIGYKKTSTHKLAVCVEYIKNFQLDYTRGIYRNALLKMHNEEGVLRDSDIYRDEYGMIQLQMSQTQAAKLLSRYVFHKIKGKDHSELDINDFEQFMNPAIAEKSFHKFDGNFDGTVSERELNAKLVQVNRERRALRTSLYDAEAAVGRLDAAVTAFVWMCLFVVYFMLLGVNPEIVLGTVSSFLLAVAFAIGNSVKALLESIIFIFVRHPYDIGDRVVIDKVVYTITRMSLLTTEMKRFDNSLMYFNNSELATRPILNLRRSPDQIDLITMQVAFHTPTSVLRKLETRVAEYLDKRSFHFYGKFEFEYKEIENTNRLMFRVWVQHRDNFQNMKKYRERRGKLILKLKRLCEDLNIEYDLPAQRVFHEGIPGEVVDDDSFRPDGAPPPQPPPSSAGGGQSGYPDRAGSVSHGLPAPFNPARRASFQRPGSVRPNLPPRQHQSRRYAPSVFARKYVSRMGTLPEMFEDGFGGYGMASRNRPEQPMDVTDLQTYSQEEAPAYQDGLFVSHSPYEPVGNIIEADSLREVEEENEGREIERTQEKWRAHRFVDVD